MTMDLKLFRELFCRVDEAYGRMTADGPKAVRSRLPEDMIRAHLEGIEMIGTYFLDHEDRTDQLVIDIDAQDPDLARAVEGQFGELGIQSYIEMSKSKGYHVRTHWDPPVPAADLRRIGLYIARQAGNPDVEVFPKQNKRFAGGLGNFMWLPLHGEYLKSGRTAILDGSNGLAALHDQWEALQSIRRNALDTLAAAIAVVEKDEPLEDQIGKIALHVAEKIPQGKRNTALTSLAGTMRRRNMTATAIASALLVENTDRCDPPLPEAEVRNIATSVARYPAAREELGSQPTISLNTQHLPTLNMKCWEAIERVNDPPQYFKHGGRSVRLENDDRGAVIIRGLTPERARHELSKAANWVKVRVRKGKRKKTPVIPPITVVNDWLATPNAPLPVLERIVDSPVFASDGTLHSMEGYSFSARSFLTRPKGLPIPPISDIPTRGELEKAKEHVMEPISEFSFVSDADLANAVGLMLLPPARDLIDGPTPMHLIESPVAGCGKTLLTDVLLMPSIGRNIGVVSETQNDEEMRKRITAQLLAARPAILLDNVNRPILSSVLAAALTASFWDDRNLGTLEMLSLPVRCVWVTTANNPTMSTEILRRCIRIRMDPRTDRPWLRDGFRHPDLRGWVEAHRDKLTWASLTLIKAWLVAGRPRSRSRPPGSYEKWCHVIGGILEHGGIHGFLGNAVEFYEIADTEDAAWRTFVEAWWEKKRDAVVGTADLFPIAKEFECLDLGEGSERSQKTSFGKQLGKQRDRVIGNYRIVSAGKSNRASHWKLQQIQEV